MMFTFNLDNPHEMLIADLDKFITSIGAKRVPSSHTYSFVYETFRFNIFVEKREKKWISRSFSKVFKIDTDDRVLRFSKASLDTYAKKFIDAEYSRRRIDNTINAKVEFLSIWLESKKSEYDVQMQTQKSFNDFKIRIDLITKDNFNIFMILTANVASHSFISKSLPDIRYTSEIVFTKKNSRYSETSDRKMFSVKKTFDEWMTMDFKPLLSEVTKRIEDLNPKIAEKQTQISELQAKIDKVKLEIAELNYSLNTFVSEKVQLVK